VFALAQQVGPGEQAGGSYLTIVGTGELIVATTSQQAALFILASDYVNKLLTFGSYDDRATYEAWLQGIGADTLLNLTVENEEQGMDAVIVRVVIPNLPILIPGKSKADPPNLAFVPLGVVP